MAHDNQHPQVRRHYRRRQGSTPEHGRAHTTEHRSFGRRDFLHLTGLAALGSSVMLGATPVSAFGVSPMLAGLANAECGDRVLVLIRLKGGNDGLNTVILRGNDEYYNIRPTLAVPESGLWALSQDYGMPNEMAALQPFWGDGRMRVVHNVGYPAPNYSHFRSSDIWASASDTDQIVSTGWIGRWLEHEYPAFQSAPPSVPLALQIGVQTNMIFRADSGNLALSVSNPQEFYQLAQSGQLYGLEGLTNSPNDRELGYVRQVANSAFRYAESIRQAYLEGGNAAGYPANRLAEELAIVARLIKGRLGTKIYMVTLDGFDTHAYQAEAHPALLNRVAEGVAAFFADLGGHAQNVVAMTFSEFGRTIFENGSVGTDHGTGAPMLLFGEGLGQGFHGTAPDLLNLDQYGDPFFSIDFRDVYATVLQNWLCVPQEVTDYALGQPFVPVEGLLPPTTPPAWANDPAALLGHRADPDQPGRVLIRYSLRQRGFVRLLMANAAGQVLRVLLNDFREFGSYTFGFSPAQYHLAPGEYVYRLEAGGRSLSRAITIT